MKKCGSAIPMSAAPSLSRYPIVFALTRRVDRVCRDRNPTHPSDRLQFVRAERQRGSATVVFSHASHGAVRPQAARKSPLRLIALIKTDDTIKKILFAMGLPTKARELCPARPARPPPGHSGGEDGDLLN